ncbi:hypothetical protein [Phormidesmis priestleyi]
MALFWLSKHGDIFDQDDDTDQANVSIDDSFIDELFNDFFEAFSEIEFDDVEVLVENIDLTEITLFDLEATQSELEIILTIMPQS